MPAWLRRVMVVVGRDLLLLAGGLFLVYAGLCAYMFLRQESYVFFPDSRIYATPESVGLAYEEASLRTADGLNLGAWWIPAQSPRGALILCHGNAGNISDRLDKAQYFHELGLSVLLFDYRGYGTSEGEPSEAGTYLDAEAAVDHALSVRGFSASRLILYGESLGGAVAAEAAGKRRPAGLILDSTFTSVFDMARKYYPWLPVRLLGRIRYDSKKKVASLPCPKLVLHSPEDDIVPFEMGEALYAAAAPPKRFAKLEGDHNSGGLLASPGAQRALESFLEESLGAASSGGGEGPPG